MRVSVFGACGRMGRTTVQAILNSEDLMLSGCFDRTIFKGIDAASGIGSSSVLITDSMEEALDSCECAVDFTKASVSEEIISKAVLKGVSIVVGTTGHSEEALDRIDALAKKYKSRVLVVPNFSIGAVLMMKFAREASAFFSSAEIIELHHDKKIDSPSGTSIRTLEGMLSERNEFSNPPKKGENDRARGFEKNGVHIHSVRLPGLVAHQEVIFGGTGEILTIRHDSLSRESFMPGVLTALRRIEKLPFGTSYGLERVL